MTLLEAIGLTALPHIGGLIGAFAMKDQVKNWYEVKIEKPPWKPPSWVSHFNSFTAILTIFTYFSIYQIHWKHFNPYFLKFTLFLQFSRITLLSISYMHTRVLKN